VVVEIDDKVLTGLSYKPSEDKKSTTLTAR
jgi:hypothetical protein